jgi:hypothetical protein
VWFWEVEGLKGEGGHEEVYCAAASAAGKDSSTSTLIDFPVRILAKDAIVDALM